MAEYQIPGGPFVNEVGSDQHQIPGGPYINETAAAGGGVTAEVTGVSATGQLGSLAITGGAGVSVSGVSATGQVGSVSVSTGVNVAVEPTGVSATGQVGSLAITAGAAISLTGVQAAGQVGTVAITGGASITLDGVSATGQVGTVAAVGESAAPGSTSVALTGVDATGQVGTVTVSGGAAITLTGVQATGQVGSLIFPSEIVVSAGRAKRAKPRPLEVFVVRIADRVLNFTSLSEALAFLEEHRNSLAQEVQRQAERAARKILSKGKRRSRKPYLPKIIDVQEAPAEARVLLDEEVRKLDRAFNDALGEILAAEGELKDVMEIARMLH